MRDHVGEQAKELRRMYAAGDYSIGDLAEMFSISGPIVFHILGRQAESQ
jgi:hypothetical protein